MAGREIFLAIGAAAALAGCAGPRATLPVEVWKGGDPARLAADQADCRRESDAIDVHEAAGYSDPRYGVTSAMAAAVADDNPLLDRKAVVRQAKFDACMNDKGWKSE